MDIDYPLKIKRSPRRKNIAVSVNSGEVTLHLPLTFPEKEIQGFLATNAATIENLIKRESSQTPPFKPVFELGATLPMLGRAAIICQDSTINMPCFKDGKFWVKALSGEKLKREIILIYNNMAAEIISKKMFALSLKHKISYQSITINAANTRWGSCGSNGAINFSWKLILCPEVLVDYVIAHELAHRVEMNHSAKFWNIVAQLYPNYKQARHALTQEAIRYRAWK